MFVSCSEEEWDAVIRVHLKGHFCVARHAAAYWRAQVKAGKTVDARIINTSSGAGVLGSVGQSSYSAAKAGLEDGDVILSFNGDNITDYGDLTNAVRKTSPGDEVEVGVYYNGDRIERVRFRGRGCSVCIASASMMTELVKGKARGDALAGALAGSKLGGIVYHRVCCPIDRVLIPG